MADPVPVPLESSPVSAAVPDGFQPSPAAALAELRWGSVVALLQAGEQDVARVVDELVVNALGRLNEHYAAVGLVLDQLIGAADNASYKPMMDLMRAIDRLVEKTKLAIVEREGDAVVAGINIPYTIADRQSALIDESASWAPLVLPGLADYMGVERQAVAGQGAAVGSEPIGFNGQTEADGVSMTAAIAGSPVGGVAVSTNGAIECPAGKHNDPVTGLCVPDDVIGGKIITETILPPCPPGGRCDRWQRVDGSWTGTCGEDTTREGLEAAGWRFEMYSPFRDGDRAITKEVWLCPIGGPPPPVPPPPTPPPPPIDGIGCCPQPDIIVTCPPVSPPPPPPPPPPPDECPKPAELPPAPTLSPLPKGGVDWCSINVCALAKEALTKFGPLDKIPANAKEAEVGSLNKAVREFFANGMSFLDWITSGFDPDVEAASYESHAKAYGEWLGGFSGTWSLMQSYPPINVRESQKAYNIGTKIAMAGRAESTTFFPASYLVTAETYLFQSLNPQYIPTQVELDRAFLADRIAKERYECLSAAHGNLPKCREWVLESSATRPGVGELVQLFMRGQFDRAEFDSRMRNMGVLKVQHSDEFLNLAQLIPPYTDLIRMMTRDAADDRVALAYGYDKNFGEKFYGNGGPADPGPVAKWAAAQGISPEVFKFLWRSHWFLPSYTQLTEMLFRYPPDRPEVVRWDEMAREQGEAAALAAFGPRPIVVTLNDVRYALEVNDFAPAWVDGMIGIAYHPLTRTDAVRAYEIGSIDRDELYWVMRRNGYDELDSQRLVKFYDLQKSRRVSNATDSWSIRKTKRIYKAGGINRAQALDHLRPVTADPSQAARVIDDADLELQADAQTHEIKAVRKAYLFGELDVRGVGTRLTYLGLGAAQQTQFLAMWNGDKEGRLKEPTLRELGRWYRRGAINGPQFMERLLRLGYTKADANRIIYSANVEEAERDAAKLEKLMREIKSRIKDQQAAKAAAEDDLKKVLKESEAQAVRIKKELNRRAAEMGLPIPYPDV